MIEWLLPAWEWPIQLEQSEIAAIYREPISRLNCQPTLDSRSERCDRPCH